MASAGLHTIEAPPQMIERRPRTSFLSLPYELRLDIYELLLTPHDNNTLAIRTEYTSGRDLREKDARIRSSYRIMSGRFRAQSIETTYVLANNPGIFSSILGVNQQIHNEATHVLYSNHTFDFGQDVEAVIPFLDDLTPLALRSIRRINIVKRALPYVKDFDRCEWRNVCDFIARNMELRHLGLGVFGGTPTSEWAAKDTFEKSDFRLISMFESMEWVKQLAAIKGLQNLDVTAHLEHCPPPRSNAMAFFVNFSASIERGFAEYLRENMLLGAA